MNSASALLKMEKLALREAIHPAWGIEHCIRVNDTAIRIARMENLRVQPDAIKLAAYLHDFGAYPKYSQSGIDHAIRSAEVARVILNDFGADQELINLIVKAIEGHMFYSAPDLTVPEAVVFHDADVLDFLGNVGIERIHSIIGIDDWTPTSRDAEILIGRFMRELPSDVITQSGKNLAKDRVNEMQDYFSSHPI